MTTKLAKAKLKQSKPATKLTKAGARKIKPATKAKSKQKYGSRFEAALTVMESKIRDSYKELVKEPRRDIAAIHKSAARSRYGYDGVHGNGGLSTAIDMQVACINELKKLRDDALLLPKGLREVQALVDSGCLSVEGAMKHVGVRIAERSRLAAAELLGRLISAPGHERLRREWNQAVNDDNRARRAAERWFGLPRGGLNDAVGPEFDSVNPEHLSKK